MYLHLYTFGKNNSIISIISYHRELILRLVDGSIDGSAPCIVVGI